MYLRIDVSPEQGFELALLKKIKGIYSPLREKFFLFSTDRLLSGIEEILRVEKADMKNLKGIVLNRGGSFTSSRTGVIVANTLGHVLDIPVGIAGPDGEIGEVISRLNRAEAFKPVFPVYHKEPNITKSKKNYL